MWNLASRLNLISPSPTLAIDSKAKAMKAAGEDIINFGAGEPDFNTPSNICEAAMKAVRDGFTRYTPTDGIMELKEAVCAKFKRDNGLDYQPSQVVISNGGKHTLYNIFMCLFQEGDQVIVPTPAWVSYPPMISLSGAEPVLVPTTPQDSYCLTPALLERALTPQTKGIILNSPSNPTGMAYDSEQLKELVPLIIKHKLWVISDDIYEKIVFGGYKFTNLPMVEPALYEQTIIAHGLSKTYAMTGWRVGYMAGPEKVARAVTMFQSQSTSNACSISQKAAVAALNGPQDQVENMVENFSRRRDLIIKELSLIPGFTCPRPLGAFYIFPDISAYFGLSYEGRAINDSEALAAYLLEQAGTAVVPGTAFGNPGCLRMSYAISDEDIHRGLSRIREALLVLK